MMQNLPLQTQSNNANIRRYGCKFYCDMAIIQDVLQQRFSDAKYLELFEDAKKNGWILDNNISINETGWYRSYVIKPKDLIEAYTKKKYSEIRITCGTDKPLKFNYVIIEFLTAYGSHFCVGTFDKGTLKIIYNPNTTIVIIGLITIRYITLVE